MAHDAILNQLVATDVTVKHSAFWNAEVHSRSIAVTELKSCQVKPFGLSWCPSQRRIRPWTCCNICVPTTLMSLLDISSTLACWMRGEAMKMTAAWSASARTGLWHPDSYTTDTQLTIKKNSHFCRLSSFFIISPSDQQVHCWSWIKKHMPSDPHLHLEDVSWKYTGKCTALLLKFCSQVAI